MSAVPDTALTAVLRRDRLVIAAALAAVTALAWGYTLWLAASMDMSVPAGGGTAMPMNDGMSMTAASGMSMLAPALKAWTAADFAFMFAMWSVMMIGMMTPSAAPMILLYARVGRQPAAQQKPFAATGFFASGYLLAWATFSLVATFGQYVLDRAALLSPTMTLTDTVLGGIVLIAAGVFQWTSAKSACLTHCQSPLHFVLRHGFRADAAGSLALGFRHGLYCVGCCWALMALLFVGGIMNVLWIAGLTVFVLLEKLVPAGRVISRLAGAALVAAGAWLLATTI
jgi:predicted metal-binding membrane protein